MGDESGTSMAGRTANDVVIAAAGHSEYTIAVAEGAHPTVAFAAAELGRYLARISGAGLPVRAVAGLPRETTLVLVRDEEAASRLLAASPAIAEPDGFRLQVRPEGIALVGQRPRGLLRAAYALLERLGCRWLGPGDEVIPTLDRLALPPGEESRKPTFPFRDSFDDCTWTSLRDPDWRRRQLADDTLHVDWLAKVGQSGLFNFRWDPADPTVDDILDEMRRRDLDMIGGGHIIPFLLPRALFSEHPEYFRMHATGERIPEGNLCVSSAEGIRVACRSAVNYVRSRPQLDALHIWGDDVAGGSWCSCPGCRGLTPQDQYVTLCNAIIGALRAAGLATEVIVIAYHDTLVPDLRVRPDPEFQLIFAPIHRCYAHALDDPTCERNAWHVENLRRWLEIMPAGRLAVFEYFTDTYRFRSLGVNVPGVVLADLRFYHRLGVRRMTNVTITVTYDYLSHPASYQAYAAGLWDPTADAGVVLDDFCRRAYGPAAGAMRHYWATMEPATAKLSTHGHPTDPPILDDWSMHRTIELVRDAARELDVAGGLLQEAAALELPRLAADRLRRDRAVWEFTRNQAGALADHLLAMTFLATGDAGRVRARAARQPDGTFVGRDHSTYRIVHRDHPGTPRGYAEAIAHLDRAIAGYERGRALLTAAAPLLGDSTWLANEGGFWWQQELLLRRLRAQRDEATDALAGHGLPPRIETAASARVADPTAGS